MSGPIGLHRPADEQQADYGAKDDLFLPGQTMHGAQYRAMFGS